jgi:hypothetical protein
MIPAPIVQSLVRLGHLSREFIEPAPELLRELEPVDWVNVMNWEAWKHVSSELNCDDHEALLMGLVRAEESLPWRGGSPSAAIAVFRALQDRIPEDRLDRLIKWVKRYSTNGYLPYGTRSDARSLAEYQQETEARAAAWNVHERHQRRLQKLARIRRARRSRQNRRKEREMRAEQRQRSEKRQEHIAELQTMRPTERLAHICSDRRKTMSYYPDSLAAIDDEDIRHLPRALLDSILERIPKGSGSGWRDLKAKVRSELRSRTDS